MNLIRKLQSVLDPIDKQYHSKDNLRLAAVLIPIFLEEEKVLFTKRTEFVKHHQGQISFPGGRFEKDDKDLLNTALRETVEEVGIKSSSIEVIGKLEPTDTLSHHYVHPFVGIISDDVSIKINTAEVAEHFFVPLAKLLETSTLKHGIFAGETRIYYEVENYKIWGITAGILTDLLSRIKSS
ncbi:MAG: CoA pyrophosphatase [Candidatus Heimdallarchaeota archaeon]|nr:CoA pyrophosphatase [Candidatus Heimdallarchaeota archaeon]